MGPARIGVMKMWKKPVVLLIRGLLFFVLGKNDRGRGNRIRYELKHLGE